MGLTKANKIEIIFEFGAVWFVLTICPQMVYSKHFRDERKRILNEIKNGKGLLANET